MTSGLYRSRIVVLSVIASRGQPAAAIEAAS